MARTLSALPAAVVAMLALAAPAFGAAKPLGLDCNDQNGVRFCQGDGGGQRVASWDGVPLDADVTLPPADKGDGPFPTIVMLHGYGGSKTDFETDSPEGRPDSSTPGRLYHWNNVWFAQRGYVVVNYTARGFGKSCGSQDSRTPDCFQNAADQDPRRPPAGSTSRTAAARRTTRSSCSARSWTRDSRSPTPSAPPASRTAAARASSWPTCTTGSRR